MFWIILICVHCFILFPICFVASCIATKLTNGSVIIRHLILFTIAGLIPGINIILIITATLAIIREIVEKFKFLDKKVF